MWLTVTGGNARSGALARSLMSTRAHDLCPLSAYGMPSSLSFIHHGAVAHSHAFANFGSCVPAAGLAVWKHDDAVPLCTFATTGWRARPWTSAVSRTR